MDGNGLAINGGSMTQEIDLTFYRLLSIGVCPALLTGTNLNKFFELLSNTTVNEMVGP